MGVVLHGYDAAYYFPILTSATERLKMKSIGINMKKVFPFIVILPLLLSGCVTAKFRISTDIEDAKILIDEKYVGDGSVICETKFQKWDFPNEVSVTITHPDYNTFRTTIRNEWDVGMGVGTALLGFGLGGYFFFRSSNELPGLSKGLDMTTAAIEIAGGAYGLMASYRFRSDYYFPMTKKK